MLFTEVQEQKVGAGWLNAFYQRHALESPIDSLPAVLLSVCFALPTAGKEVVRISIWEPLGR
jgi:hypothetical protein